MFPQSPTVPKGRSSTGSNAGQKFGVPRSGPWGTGQLWGCSAPASHAVCFICNTLCFLKSAICRPHWTAPRKACGTLLVRKTRERQREGGSQAKTERNYRLADQCPIRTRSDHRLHAPGGTAIHALSHWPSLLSASVSPCAGLRTDCLKEAINASVLIKPHRGQSRCCWVFCHP